MAIILPELPYAYDALEPHIDAETMTLHHDKHHATYVANANAALEKHPEIGEDLESLLADVEKIPADIRQALINNGGGHLNHALSGSCFLLKNLKSLQNWQQTSMQPLVHLMPLKTPSPQQQPLVLVLAGLGWLSIRKASWKSSQLLTRIAQSCKVCNLSWPWMSGSMLTISTTAMFVQTTSRLSLKLSTGTRSTNSTQQQNKSLKSLIRQAFLSAKTVFILNAER